MPIFESYGLKSGQWTGKLTADVLPARVYLALYGKIVATAELAEHGTGIWEVAAELPATVLNDGMQCVLLVADNGNQDEAPLADAQVLGHLNLMAGAPLDSDLVAEVQLLRAEIDMIKREFRRLASFDDN